MFLKLNGNELKIDAPKKLKLRRAKSGLTLGSLAVFPLFLVFKHYDVVVQSNL